MTDLCTACGNRPGTASTCVSCNPSSAIGGSPVSVGPRGGARLRSAGFAIGGGALAIIISAFLPWLSGVASANLPAPATIIVLALGAALGLLGVRVILAKATTLARFFLWLLAVLDLIVVVAFFFVVKESSTGVGAMLQATGVARPGTGFYLALIGLIATIVGTVMMQTVNQDKRRDNTNPKATPISSVS